MECSSKRIFENSKREKDNLLTKDIHGWLATTKRRFREGKSTNPTCKLCRTEENRTHLLVCPHEQIIGLRSKQWNLYVQEMGRNTDIGFKIVFQTGLMTVIGGAPPTMEAKDEWPRDLGIAYEIQNQIGWELVLYGRIAKHWEVLTHYGAPGTTGRQPQWTALGQSA